MRVRARVMRQLLPGTYEFLYANEFYGENEIWSDCYDVFGSLKSPNLFHSQRCWFSAFTPIGYLAIATSTQPSRGNP